MEKRLELTLATLKAKKKRVFAFLFTTFATVATLAVSASAAGTSVDFADLVTPDMVNGMIASIFSLAQSLVPIMIAVLGIMMFVKFLKKFMKG